MTEAAEGPAAGGATPARQREQERVRKLQAAVQAYLSKIGPRALTDEEARELQLIRIRHGEDSPVWGMIEILAREADDKAKAAERPAGDIGLPASPEAAP